ncbi:MAG: elongation factor G, partial [Stellaceae bacterium]
MRTAERPPEPLLEIAVEPRSSKDRQKLDSALSQLVQHDRPLSFSVDREAGQVILKGADEHQLKLVVDRMKREFKVDANIGAPQVAYRETITRAAEIDYIHRKQTGGSGQFARVKVRFEPLPPGSGFVFENSVVGGTVPKEFVPGV